MPVGFLSRGGAMVGSHPTARYGPSRAAGYTQVCFFLILGIGSLLIFSYQSEIYATLGGKDVFISTPLSRVTSRPAKTFSNKPEIKVERETSRSRQQPQVFALPGSEDKNKEFDFPRVENVEENITVRKLESSEPSSPGAGSISPSPGLPRSSTSELESHLPDSSSNSTLIVSPNNSSSSEIPASKSKEPPAKFNKNDKKKAVDLTNPLYVPLAENVHSNLISTKYSLVIKVLAVNSYGSLLRLLSSLHEVDYAGDRVDLHIYIDHFQINAVVEERKRLRRRLLLQSNAANSTNSNLNILHGDEDVLDLETESVGEDSIDLDGKDVKKTDRIRPKKKTKRKGKRTGTRKLGDDESAEVQEPQEVPDKVNNYVDVINANDSWGIVENKLRDTRRVLGLADRWEWKYGTKVLHYRSKAAGYQGQWIDSWWPSSDDEFALIVDDDMELSPLFYRYVRSVISTYHYQSVQYDPSVYGISLQRPQLVPGKSGQPIRVDDRTRLYMYEMVGIWGQVFFPKPWKEFRTWYDTKKSHDQKPVLEGMVTTDWYRQHGEKMWTPWFVKFVHSRGYYSLYTNFLKDRVLSVSHRSESPKTKKYAGCDSSLIWSNSTYDLDIFHMAPMKTIKRYDYCFKEVFSGRFANKSKELSQVLSTVHENKVVLMLSTVNVAEPLVRNWICALRKLGISNYVFFGEDPALLEDLARRGHASVRFEFNERLTENGEKEVDAVLNVLRLGYDVWFVRTDMIWVGNPLSLFDWGDAHIIGSANPMLNLFYIRSTKETVDAWSSFHGELNKAVENSSKQLNFETAREAFIQKCDSEEKIKVQPLDKVVFLSADKLTGLPSEEGVVPEGQVVLFSKVSTWGDRELSKKATLLNLWNLDDDLVCTQVIC